MVVLQYCCVQLLLKCPICRCGVVDREKDSPFVAGSKYDLPADIVDAENIRGNAYVAQDKCAAARIEFIAEENSVTDLINGKLTFHQHLAPYVPAEDILNTLEFDPDALQSALTGG